MAALTIQCPVLAEQGVSPAVVRVAAVRAIARQVAQPVQAEQVGAAS